MGAEPGIWRSIAVRFQVDVRLSFVRGALSGRRPLLSELWPRPGTARRRSAGSSPCCSRIWSVSRARPSGWIRRWSRPSWTALPVPRGGRDQLRWSGGQDPGRRHRRPVRRARCSRGRRRARCAASLRMQRSIVERVSDLELPIRMRIGINTGEVLVGALRAGGDYTAMGDVVNIARACRPPHPRWRARRPGDPRRHRRRHRLRVRRRGRGAGPRGEGGGVAGHRADHAARTAAETRARPVRGPRAGALAAGRHRAHRPLAATRRPRRHRGGGWHRQDPSRRGGPDRSRQAAGRHGARRFVRALRRGQPVVADRRARWRPSSTSTWDPSGRSCV